MEWLRRQIAGNPRLHSLVRVLRGHNAIFVPPGYGGVIGIDYPLRSRARYGYGQPPHGKLHEILSRARPTYTRHLHSVRAFEAELTAIPLESPNNPSEPQWLNRYLPSLDAMALYAFIALRKPKLYVEVGSGNSTLFAARAIRSHDLPTKIVSIDPSPRLPVDGVSQQQIRTPLEETDLAVFDALGDGDVLFMDGSHRTLMNSDATVFFLDVLPRLKRGVLVGIHDILLPYDYPPDWTGRFYSEQYLLAAFLLADGDKITIELPAMFVSEDAEFGPDILALFASPVLSALERLGSIFWFSIAK
jgi:predicted O-methyltransferase YrrM